MNLKD